MNLRLLGCSAFSLLALCTFTTSNGATVIDFEGLPTTASGFYNGDITATSPLRDNFTITGTSTFIDFFGTEVVETQQLWNAGGVGFKNNYTAAYTSWSGWSISKVQDTTTAGFGNQYASFTGGGSDGGIGFNSGNYAVAFGSNAFFNLPIDTVVQSARITNTTYSALSMLNGDSFAKKFGGLSGNDQDLFTARLTGFDALGGTGSSLGSVEVVLADYRFGDNSQDFILSNWLNVDLTPLGLARSVGITFTTTDVGQFGANTPFYLALDNLTITAVPEPGSLLVVAVAAFGFLCRYSKRRASRTVAS